jgi:hypothetical protein
MPKQVHFHNNTSIANTAIEQKLRKYIESCNEEYYPESLFDDLYDENFIAIDAGKRVTRYDEKTIHAVWHHQRAKVELRRFHQVEPNQYDLQLAFVKEDETFVVSKIVTVENGKITNAFDYNVKSIPTTRGPKIVAHPFANKARINRIGMNNQIPLDFTPM